MYNTTFKCGVKNLKWMANVFIERDFRSMYRMHVFFCMIEKPGNLHARKDGLSEEGEGGTITGFIFVVVLESVKIVLVVVHIINETQRALTRIASGGVQKIHGPTSGTGTGTVNEEAAGILERL